MRGKAANGRMALCKVSNGRQRCHVHAAASSSRKAGLCLGDNVAAQSCAICFEQGA